MVYLCVDHVHVANGDAGTHLCSLLAKCEADWRRGEARFQCKTRLSLDDEKQTQEE